MNTKRLVLLVTAIVVLFLPFPTSVCPEWRIRVIDERGVPLPGKQVDQSCMNYTLGIDPCAVPDARQFADSDGVVRFPKRVIWAGLLSRILRSGFHIAMWPAEGSLGSKVFVFTSGPHYPEIHYDPNSSLPDVLIVKDAK